MTRHIGFIGGGNMARALIGGLLGRGLAPEALRVGEPHQPTAAALARDFGIEVSADNRAAIAGATLVILAVKPQEAGRVLAHLCTELQAARPVLLSVAAGIRSTSLQQWCGAGVAVVRAMPNRPALVGAGATALYAPAAVTAAQRSLAEEAMSAAGAVVWVRNEADLDVVTALSGSGPAYFFLLAELMMRRAMQLGLGADTARTLTVQTLYGAGALAHQPAADLARLRAEVTSRGGTTEAALAVFERENLPRIVAGALDAAAQRSRELAAQFSAAPGQ